MKFDPQTIRLLGRLTDQMNLIRKGPHRYQVHPAVEAEIAAAGPREIACIQRHAECRTAIRGDAVADRAFGRDVACQAHRNLAGAERRRGRQHKDRGCRSQSSGG